MKKLILVFAKIVFSSGSNTPEEEYRIFTQKDSFNEGELGEAVKKITRAYKVKKPAEDTKAKETVKISGSMEKVITKIEFERRLTAGKTQREFVDMNVFMNNRHERIISNMADLEKDLKQLMVMGTGLLEKDLREVKAKFEQNYPDIETIEEKKEALSTGGKKDRIVMEGIKMFYDMYEAFEQGNSDTDNPNKIEKTDEKYYYISVRKFKEEYMDSDIADEMTIKEFRSILKEHGITRCSTGRSDFTETELGKTIAFKINELEKYNKEYEKKYKGERQ